MAMSDDNEKSGHGGIKNITKGADELPPYLQPVDPTTLEGKVVPVRKWAVEHWIPHGVVTGLYGDGGIGKTLAVQQLQTCMALGISWFGLKTTPMRTLGIYCEDHIDELHRRQADINKFYGCTYTQLEAVRWVPRLGCDNIIMNFTGASSGRMVRTEFLQQIIAAAKLHEAHLVIMDTVSDSFGGGENDRAQVRQYVQAGLGYIALEIEGSVMACAHPSRTGLQSGQGDSGSTGWNNAFRSRLYLTTPKQDVETSVVGDPEARILARKKANYASRTDEVKLRWHDGVFVTEIDEHGNAARHSVETVFMGLLDRLTEEGRYVSHSPKAGNYAPTVFMSHPGREGYLKGDFIHAVNTLFEQNIIRIGEYQYDRKTHPCIQRTVAEAEADIPF